MSYKVTRRDVYNYVIDSSHWVPAWLPQPFVAINSVEDSKSITTMNPPKLIHTSTEDLFVDSNESDIANRQMHALITFVLRGEFVETLELENFPFDVQVVNSNVIAACNE